MQTKLMHEYFQKGLKEKEKNTDTGNSMALLYFIKASDLGHPEATATLGDIFLYKLFGEQNYELAMQYYQKAINLNSPKGYEAMGMLYHDGDGVERSFRTAYKYYLNSNTYISHLNKSIIESIHYDEVKDLIPLQNLKLEKNECSECQSSIDTYIGQPFEFCKVCNNINLLKEQAIDISHLNKLYKVNESINQEEYDLAKELIEEVIKDNNENIFAYILKAIINIKQNFDTYNGLFIKDRQLQKVFKFILKNKSVFASDIQNEYFTSPNRTFDILETLVENNLIGVGKNDSYYVLGISSERERTQRLEKLVDYETNGLRLFIKKQSLINDKALIEKIKQLDSTYNFKIYELINKNMGEIK